MKLAAREA